MEKIDELHNSLLKVQEEFFEELGLKLKKDFYYIKDVIVNRCSVNFKLDTYYSVRIEGVNLILIDGMNKYRIHNLSDLFTYLKIKSTVVVEEEDS